MQARRSHKVSRTHRRLLVPKRQPSELDTREGRAIDRVRASVCEGKVISMDVLRRLLKRA
ncbi:MAG TPA: hypothetical protein VF403_09685 [Kofleriaceae bacterium]